MSRLTDARYFENTTLRPKLRMDVLLSRCGVIMTRYSLHIGERGYRCSSLKVRYDFLHVRTPLIFCRGWKTRLRIVHR
jgi:hypothetical protein